ncbi:MAG: hypothetical protein KDC43_26210 [Saprospiraceae bacterium]|nr:hypothetical protein [Saprospiraceae bacterium]MCB0627315.1 hypothetical protein [Saprospiraceae bacterium]MCB0683192.1 hypothetical protein [Saprospiraceae bacterium]
MPSNHALDSIENFRRESLSLLLQIDQNIRELSAWTRMHEGRPSRALVEDMNRLKLRRTSLIRLLEELEGASSAYWAVRKKDAQRLFRRGRAALQSVTETIGRSQR